MTEAEKKDTEPRLIPADPAKAFHVITDMDCMLADLEHAAEALRHISMSDDKEIHDAVFWVSRIIYGYRESLGSLYSEVFHLLHGCAHPEMHREH